MGTRRVLIAATFALFLAACQKDERVVVPDVFRVKFETSQGDFVVEATKAWAPRGVNRFDELLRMHYFDENRFFRVVPGFIAQFGVNKDYDVHDRWRKYFILDDPPQEKNLRQPPGRHAAQSAVIRECAGGPACA